MTPNRIAVVGTKLSAFVPLLLLLSILLSPARLGAQENAAPRKPVIDYGQNPAAGAFASVNGIKLYVETYGKGTPLLLIHGNGGSIADMKNQIEFFAPHYQVIVADSRGHGKSEIGAGRLTYEQMAEDFNALLEQRALKSVHILGWSDGGILGLLLAIHHPDKVAKLAIMGANLRPSGAYDWALEWVARQNQLVDMLIARGDKTQPWTVVKQHLDLLGKQPNIPLTDVQKINAPTLVMAGDKDVIRAEHTLEIFENLPKAHLCIFPGSTHIIPVQNPALFNRTVATFFEQPYTRPDTKYLFK